jgi:anti-sigma B factor antagonist
MDIVEEKQGVIYTFKIKGRLDSNTSQEFEKRVFDVITNGTKSVIIDFKDLDYISSAGLRVILKATKALKREDGKIMLCAMQDYVKEVFEIAGFDSFLPIVPTLDDARRRCERRAGSSTPGPVQCRPTSPRRPSSRTNCVIAISASLASS